MSGCNCCSEGVKSPFRSFDLRMLAELKQEVLQSVPPMRGCDEARLEERILKVDGNCTYAIGVDKGRKGCLTSTFFGVPFHIWWDIEEFDVAGPGAKVKIRLVMYVNQIEAFSLVYLLECANISDPSTCRVELNSPDAKMKWKCDEECLSACEPSCLYCGTDYYCWIICSATCAAKCCKLSW